MLPTGVWIETSLPPDAVFCSWIATLREIVRRPIMIASTPTATTKTTIRRAIRIARLDDRRRVGGAGGGLGVGLISRSSLLMLFPWGKTDFSLSINDLR